MPIQRLRNEMTEEELKYHFAYLDLKSDLEREAHEKAKQKAKRRRR